VDTSSPCLSTDCASTRSFVSVGALPSHCNVHHTRIVYSRTYGLPKITVYLWFGCNYCLQSMHIFCSNSVMYYERPQPYHLEGISTQQTKMCCNGCGEMLACHPAMRMRIRHMLALDMTRRRMSTVKQHQPFDRSTQMTPCA